MKTRKPFLTGAARTERSNAVPPVHVVPDWTGFEDERNSLGPKASSRALSAPAFSSSVRSDL